jgi:hypothetical protein
VLVGASVVAALVAGLTAPTWVPMLLQRHLRGTMTGWPELDFFHRVTAGGYLGGVVTNGLAAAFLLGLRRFRFPERFLALLAALTLPMALGFTTTGLAALDGVQHQLVRHRWLPHLGVLVALFAGGAVERLRELAARRLSRRAQWAPAAFAVLLAALVAADAAGRARPLAARSVKTDSHYLGAHTAEFRNAFAWLRDHASRPGVVGVDGRPLRARDPGLLELPARVVLEADRFALQGNQIEATRNFTNADVLLHLHDREPEQLHAALVRHNVSHLLTWSSDVTANLARSARFVPVHRTTRLTVWAVQGHDFRFLSGEGVRAERLDFAPGHVRWTVAADPPGGPATLAVAHHPRWQATIGGRPAPLIETPDHLLEVAVPAGRSELEISFHPDPWETPLRAVALAALAATLSLFARRR